MRLVFLTAFAAIAVGVSPPLAASEPAGTTVTLTLKDHRFNPALISVPADQKVRIVLINHDHATEEFDSLDLSVEEDVTPNGRVSFDVGPLTPGSYDFMGEFHPKTAQGRIVVSAP